MTYHSFSSYAFTCLFLLFISQACVPPKKQHEGGDVSAPDYELPYDLTSPHAGYRLPDKLLEISGMEAINQNEIACVQDEAGTVYIFNHPMGDIEGDFAFGKDGDYEGVSIVDSTSYVLRSSGKIYEVQNFRTDSQKTIKHKTFLKKTNNTEGLTYDKANNRLLISCRGIPGNDESLSNLSTIYAFDLETKTLDSVPIFTISVDDIYEFMGVGNLQKGYEKATNFLLPGSIGRIIFHPSGIAIHPFSKNIYMVTSEGGLIIVLNQEGDIQFIGKLNKEWFIQPEGITFLPNGDLLIANEGRSRWANLLRFGYMDM